jgi:Peptidase U49
VRGARRRPAPGHARDHLPTPKCKAGDPWDRINNVFFGVIAFILLHEVSHVSLRHQIILPAQMQISQESDAGIFAANWFFEKVSTPERREFRILFVGVALARLFLFEPKESSAEHPSAKTRLERAASHFEAAADSVSLEVVTHLPKVLFISDITPPQLKTSQEYFDWIALLFRD